MLSLPVAKSTASGDSEDQPVKSLYIIFQLFLLLLWAAFTFTFSLALTCTCLPVRTWLLVRWPHLEVVVASFAARREHPLPSQRRFEFLSNAHRLARSISRKYLHKARARTHARSGVWKPEVAFSAGRRRQLASERASESIAARFS